ncbi:hypothetical protein ILUMI_05986 [Ignelater luminosus]|uniref:type I protein arginine methyltransferase n=1 Tax=Ignelater luminosus TaxID=2038154 RepID=A0A8K0DA49_IGNLU|nr:hypothetical protein ILUMI_05986 [Ignelater luminosus]
MEYFLSYEDLEVHKCMLQDTKRNEAYHKAIFDNKEAFKGKIVLDVGAGTGILSVFCAQAGAAKVYAVEASETYKLAIEVAQENNLQDVIQVIHSPVETLTLPEDGKVDIIVSEWMGHFLLHEGMLDSVIFARDKFLRPGGLIFPENATLFSAPCSIPSLNDYWKDVCGVSMTRFSDKLKAQTCQSPKIMTVKSDDVLSDPEVLLWIDLREITVEELNLSKIRHLAVVDKPGNYQGICLWFACAFPATDTEPVYLSTDPDEGETHWKQTVIVLPADIPVEEGTPIPYEISIKRSEEDHRKYTIEVQMLDDEAIEHPEYCTCFKTRCILARAVLEKYEQNSFSNEN